MRDLGKSPFQLLADAHHELMSDRDNEVNLVHANKRIASIMIQTAESNKRLSRGIFWLTVVLVVLTVVMVVRMFM